MNLHKVGTIDVRAQVCRYALVGAMLLAALGCSRNRQSYRPVYTSPARTSAPCVGCDSGAGAVDSGSTTSSVIPQAPDAGTIESTVPSLPGSGKSVKSAPADEAPPRSRIGSEPSYDPNSSSSSRKPAAPSKSQGGTSGPALQGPEAAVRGSAAAIARADQASSSQKLVRKASLDESLQDYLDPAGADQLAYPDKADRPWKYIVLHHSATPTGDYAQIDREHKKTLGFDGCGYHFVIGNGAGSDDGKIEVAARWSQQKQGVHCRNARSHDVEDYGIGICLIGNLDQKAPTARQVAAMQALVAYLEERYNIAPARVATHKHLAATATVCPGRYFPDATLAGTARQARKQGTLQTTWMKVDHDTKSD